MALPDLIASLEADVEARAARILEDARSHAARIANESRDRVRSARADDLGATERTARAAAIRRIGEAEKSARAERIVARTAMLDTVFKDATAGFAEVLEDARYRESIPAQLRDAVSFVSPVVQMEIRCSGGLRDVTTRGLPADGRARIAADLPGASGFEVLAEDGRLRVDGTLEGRLASLRPQLSIEVLRAFDDVG
jgi:vacuolar-type H+-ATPase subunit E/Vma4